MARARSRRQAPAEAEGGEAWLTTYADAITLLLAFFVMLYSMTTTDVQRFREFVQGLAEPFGNESVRNGLLPDGPSVIGPGGETSDPIDTLSERTPVQLEDAPVVQPTADHDALDDIRSDVGTRLRDADLADAVDYTRVERGLVISIRSDDVLFDTGSSTIRPEGRRVLRALAPSLRNLPDHIEVEGHTDNQPFVGTSSDNWQLSTDRALAVLRLLVGFGVDPATVGAVGYGEFRPRASNATSTGRSANRRVDIVIVAPPSGD